MLKNLELITFWSFALKGQGQGQGRGEVTGSEKVIAFDTVRHSTLLQKLASLDIPDTVYNCL